VDRKKIEMAEPLKAVGAHDVRVRLYAGVSSMIQVKITAGE
jgi:ribosomal protein L9